MRRVWLYSLIAVASLVIVGALTVGIGGALNSGDGVRVAQVNTPTVPDPPAPEPVSRNTQEGEQAEQERGWREIAEQRGAEDRSAAERRAAEQQAAEEAQPAIPTDTDLSLTVPSAGIQNNPVTDSIDENVLANGAGKIPSTGFPWQDGANTYIAAHVYGYPGTGSWQQFARVPRNGYGATRSS